MLAAAAIGASTLMAAPAFAETRSPAATQHQLAPLHDPGEPWWVLAWALKRWDRWENWNRWDDQWHKMYLWKYYEDLADEDHDD